MILRISDEFKDNACYRYARDVCENRIIACVKVKQACTRFLNDLRRVHNPKFPWTFSVERAYRPITFIEQFLKPSKGSYEKMELLPWQHFVEANIYGWIEKRTGLRRFRDAIIIVGAGNGKSTLVVGNCAYAASKDGEPGADVYVFANSLDQAKKTVFNECKTQISNSPMLAKHFRVTTNAIYYDRANSSIQPAATDSKNLDGLNPHLAIFDEIHEYKNYKLINIIDQKKEKRRQPISIYITTLGNVIDGPLMDFYQLSEKILNEDAALDKSVSDRVFLFVAELDAEDEVDNPAMWIKANPSLGGLINIDDFAAKWEKCKLVPDQRSDFINKRFNIFTQIDEMSFLDPETINKNKKIIDLKELEGKLCYGGFDLAESVDFTSACLEFPLDDGFFILEHSWVPIAKVKENKEKLNWQMLVKSGCLTVVEHPYVDYTLVLQWYLDMRELYRIETIGYDTAKATLLVNNMREKGFLLETVRQGELTLTAPLDHMRECFLDGKIIHNNDPLYTWYLGNVKLTKRSHGATYLPTKRNKNRKIDGFAAHLNAHTIWLRKYPTQISPTATIASVIKLPGVKRK